MIPEKTFKAEEKQMRKGKSRLPVVRGACSSWVLAATAHNARRLPRPRKGGTITSCRISTPLVYDHLFSLILRVQDWILESARAEAQRLYYYMVARISHF